MPKKELNWMEFGKSNLVFVKCDPFLKSSWNTNDTKVSMSKSKIDNITSNRLKVRLTTDEI